MTTARIEYGWRDWRLTHGVRLKHSWFQTPGKRRMSAHSSHAGGYDCIKYCSATATTTDSHSKRDARQEKPIDAHRGLWAATDVAQQVPSRTYFTGKSYVLACAKVQNDGANFLGMKESGVQLEVNEILDLASLPTRIMRNTNYFCLLCYKAHVTARTMSHQGYSKIVIDRPQRRRPALGNCDQDGTVNEWNIHSNSRMKVDSYLWAAWPKKRKVTLSTQWYATT